MENPWMSTLYFAKNTTYEGILDVPFYSLQVFFIQTIKVLVRGGESGKEEMNSP